MKAKAKKRTWIGWAIIRREDGALIEVYDTRVEAFDAVWFFGGDIKRSSAAWAVIKKVEIKEI